MCPLWTPQEVGLTRAHRGKHDRASLDQRGNGTTGWEKIHVKQGPQNKVGLPHHLRGSLGPKQQYAVIN